MKIHTASLLFSYLICTISIEMLSGDETSFSFNNNIIPSVENAACTPRYVGSINARHIEGKGIGYRDGYTTIEGFYAYSHSNCRFIPFVDLRGHIFDNGKFASNAGVGLRYLYDKKEQYTRVQGIGVYYDYRKTNHYRFNQVAFTYDNLGKHYDWRVNGYLPFGRKHSPWRESGVGGSGSGNFQVFQGHYLLLNGQGMLRREVVLWGANAELGSTFYQKRTLQCYGAIGPYYFGRDGKNAAGGEARLSATFGKYIKLQVNGSYDSVFGWIGQGEFSFRRALGSPRKSSKGKKTNYCSKEDARQRASQRVERDEIIVTSHQRKPGKAAEYAINPLTGLPYYFVFVNNGGNSDGSFESPYATLTDAQINSSPGDIIYVYPGNGTYDVNSNPGMVLADNQKLWGSGLSYTLPTQQGPVTIPAQSSQNPSITNSNIAGQFIVGLAGNSCEVAGLSLSTNLFAAILAETVTNVSVHDCIVSTTGSTIVGIGVHQCQGDFSIVNNTIFNNAPGSLSIAVFDGNVPSVDATINISGNTVTSSIFNQGSAIALAHSSSGHITASILDNNITGMGQGVMIADSQDNGGSGGGGTLCGLISGNRIDNETIGNSNGIIVGIFGASAASQFYVEVSNNTVNNAFNYGLSAGIPIIGSLVTPTPGSILCLYAHDNNVNGDINDYAFSQAPNGTFYLQPDISHFSNVDQSGMITSSDTPNPACSFCP